MNTNLAPRILIKGKPIKYFNGCYARDKNKSGIVLALDLDTNNVILPADHHYNQITNSVIPELISKNNILVVPHHGGKAGKFLYSLKAHQRPTKAIVSVGKNNYGHPKENIIEKLRKKKFKVLQIRFIKEDIEVNLK